MNQEQVDAMCPEERRRREEVKREVSDACWWTRCLSVQRFCRGGLSRPTVARDGRRSFLSWVSGLFVNNLGWSEDPGSSSHEEHTPSSNEDVMEGVVSAEDNEAVKEAVRCCPN